MSVLNLQEKNCILNYGKNNLRKIAELFYIFLTTPGKVEEHVELIGKMSAEKTTIQPSCFHESVHTYDIEILNLFDPELKMIMHPLYKCYPRFSKIDKNSAHLNQFLVLLYDCKPNFKYLSNLFKESLCLPGRKRQKSDYCFI